MDVLDSLFAFLCYLFLRAELYIFFKLEKIYKHFFLFQPIIPFTFPVLKQTNNIVD